MKDVLLAEYQAAQSSAQHHDQLVWTVTSIVWGGSLVLMGIILKSNMTGWSGVASLSLCVLGFFLALFVGLAQWQFRSLKKNKYERCKEIEIALGMMHHRNQGKKRYPDYCIHSDHYAFSCSLGYRSDVCLELFN